MTLETAFERVYLISLSYCREKRERAVRHLLAANLIGSEKAITFIDAVSGDRVGGGPQWWSAGNGAWGCLASHSKCVWEACNDRLESYMVLEDDVVAHGESARIFAEAFAELENDWAQFYLGGQHLADPSPVPGKRWLLQAGNVNRTHAFALRKTAFEAFQRHIWHAPDYIRAVEKKRKNGWHIDDQLGDAHARRQWPTRCPRWWILGQGGGNSNISGKQEPTKYWHWWEFRTQLPFVVLPPDWSRFDLERAGLAGKLHCGDRLVPGRLTDKGLGRIFAADPEKRGELLDAWLLMIAGQAIDRGLVPAIQHRNATMDLVSDIWKSDRVLAPGDLEPDDFRYPFEGRFAFDPRAPEVDIAQEADMFAA